MNAFLAVLRRISLGAIVILVLSLALKREIPTGYIGIFIVISPLLYLLFVFFSWLSIKYTTDKISSQMEMDIPSNSFFASFIRSLFIDILSPLGVIFDLFSNTSTKFAMFIFTYIIILGYLGLWFFVL